MVNALGFSHTSIPSDPLKGKEEISDLDHHSKDKTNNKAIEVFNKYADQFENFYLAAPMLAKKLSSENFGHFVKCLENCLLIVEEASKDCTGVQSQNKLSEMKAKFEEVYEMIPPGPSVLLQRDLNRLSQLTKIAKNETYICEWGEFYQPKISLFELSMFFEKFTKKHGYSGVSVTMKTDRDYTNCSNKMMMTSIAFKFEDHSNSFFSFFNKKGKKTSREDQTKEVIDLIMPQLSKWRFAGFQVGHTDDIKERLAKQGIDVKQWGLYIDFFHIKVIRDEKTGEFKALESPTYNVQVLRETPPAQKCNVKKNEHKIKAKARNVKEFFVNFFKVLMGFLTKLKKACRRQVLKKSS